MKITYIIYGLLSFIVLFKTIQFLILVWLKSRLKNRNLSSFTKTLGEVCEYRLMFFGLRRYKWTKFWVLVKASFNENDELVYSEIKMQFVLKLKPVLNFIS